MTSVIVNGDVGDEVIDHYVSVISAARSKSTFTSSKDCVIRFDERSNVTGISLGKFEIPHTRYVIDRTNNTLYISEKTSEDVFNYFGLQASTGGCTIRYLGVSIELCQNTPIIYKVDTVMVKHLFI